jgi:hypothetical protein
MVDAILDFLTNIPDDLPSESDAIITHAGRSSSLGRGKHIRPSGVLLTRADIT